MKQWIALLLTCCMLFSLVIPAAASSPTVAPMNAKAATEDEETELTLDEIAKLMATALRFAQKKIQNSDENLLIDHENELEDKYEATGSYKVSSKVYKSGADFFDTFKVWYPTKMTKSNKTYPVIVFANGTGTPYESYEDVFEHLASWGFITIGTSDEQAGMGKSTSLGLAMILKKNRNKNSIFYHKIDTDHIGVSGHSQGGPGAINAATLYKNSDQFTAMFTGSCVQEGVAEGMEYPYDITKVKIPYFMDAGELYIDATIIAPRESMISNYERLPEGLPAVRGIRRGAEHGDILRYSLGYETAWFLYTLKGDSNAAKCFLETGDELPELYRNKDWSDVGIKNLKPASAYR